MNKKLFSEYFQSLIDKVLEKILREKVNEYFEELSTGTKAKLKFAKDPMQDLEDRQEKLDEVTAEVNGKGKPDKTKKVSNNKERGRQNRKVVKEAIREGYKTVSDIAERTDLTEQTVYGTLSNLKKAEQIEKIPGKGWEVIE